MRPSMRLILLMLVLAAGTVFAALFVEEAGPLVFAIWAGLVLLGIVDLFLTQNLRNISLSAEMPESGYIGTSADVLLELEATKNRLPNRIELAMETGLGITSGDLPDIKPATGASAIKTRIPLPLTRRGESELRSVYLRWASRLGLFEIIGVWFVNQPINIMPNIGPVLSGEINIQMMPLLDGMKDMSLKGEGSEFHQLRDFAQGMDPRSIDWKRSARMRTMVARETRAEKNHQIILCLDSGHLMGEQIGDLAKLDHAINAALALTWAGALGGDHIGFYNFDSRPRLFVPPVHGRTAFNRLQGTCSELQSSPSETNHTLGLTHLMGQLKRRSLVIVFSDFVDTVTAELLIENMGVMTRHHLVLYVALRDPALQAIANPDQFGFESVSQSVAATQVLQEHRAVLDRLGRLGVLCLDTEPGNLTADLISRYIDIKAQELI